MWVTRLLGLSLRAAVDVLRALPLWLGVNLMRGQSMPQTSSTRQSSPAPGSGVPPRPPTQRAPEDLRDRLRFAVRTLDEIERQREYWDDPYIALNIEAQIIDRELRDLERAIVAEEARPRS
ncbi:MAG: hypothetical protein U0Q18_02040 [Bryobacteraceae bacterium]